MLSLLELSYYNSKSLKFEYIMSLSENHIYRILYDKIVEKVRNKIRKALRKNQMEIRLNMIYLCKTQTFTNASYDILGNISNYKGSLWRISSYYAVSTFITLKKDLHRILDVMDTVDMVLPYKDYYHRSLVNDELCNINNMIKNNEDTNIESYNKAYYNCGTYLMPYLIDI